MEQCPNTHVPRAQHFNWQARQVDLLWKLGASFFLNHRIITRYVDYYISYITSAQIDLFKFNKPNCNFGHDDKTTRFRGNIQKNNLIVQTDQQKEWTRKPLLRFFPWCFLENSHSVRRSHCLRHPRQPRHQRKGLKRLEKRNQRRRLRSRGTHGRGNPVILVWWTWGEIHGSAGSAS